MVVRVGIVGCGTIGREIAHAIDGGRIDNVQLVSVFDIVNTAADKLALELNSKPVAYSDFTHFISSESFSRIDIIVECASQEAVRKFGKTILESGKGLMIMSVGALSDTNFLSDLTSTALKTKGHIFIPTGAIAGIDSIRSVKNFLDSVTLTTTKHPRALAGAPFFERKNIKAEDITERKIIFEGTAFEAVKEFPANVNVAAVLSIAGIGINRTMVRVVADPKSNVNQHEIIARGKFGEIVITVRNVPSPSNPKTSYLAVLSAIECLRSVCNDLVRIGS